MHRFKDERCFATVKVASLMKLSQDERVKSKRAPLREMLLLHVVYGPSRFAIHEIEASYSMKYYCKKDGTIPSPRVLSKNCIHDRS